MYFHFGLDKVHRPNRLHEAYNKLRLPLGANIDQVKRRLAVLLIFENAANLPYSRLERSRRDAIDAAEGAAAVLIEHLDSEHHDEHGACACKPYEDVRSYGNTPHSEVIESSKATVRLHEAFEVLGLEPGSSLPQIAQRYRALAKVWHPDLQMRQSDKLFFERELKKINISKELLTSHFQGASHKTAVRCDCQPLPRLPEHASEKEAPWCAGFRQALERTGGLTRSSRTGTQILERACALLSLELYDESIEDFTWLIDHHSTDTDFYERRAVCFEKLRQYGRAIVEYDTLITFEPMSARYYLRRAAIYNKLEQYDLFFQDMRKAFELQPETNKK